ncbi:Do family serine endopeptidase [Tabrizicola sp. YIM 78059]|uniref:Do family serine endopeptidase n=1 Tax=Tabrizicola sp. YIM 78059 TaxID=2529861 RepID=UPI0010A9B3D2|nr:Do family serine endopeptidase [Tabrizicola sp. YIM 78059]
MSSRTFLARGRAALVALSLGVSAAVAEVPALPSGNFDADARGIPTLAPVIGRVAEAVVNISVLSERPAATTPLFRDPFFAPFLPPVPPEGPVERQMSAGSGVIVDAEKGYVLTNNHVIADATEIRVGLRDGRSLTAELVGTDPATDIAVLKVPSEGLTAIEPGDSDQLLVGDYVVAIGNPFNLGQTVTLGIVSALGRSGINPQGYEDFIQTDASINPGNSGGALITLDGRLVGINTAIIAPNGGGNVGIGFAVPVNMALAVMEQLVEHGAVSRGKLGVAIQDLTPDLAEAMALDAEAGVVVGSVEPGSAADKAGLRAGDVILSIDGHTLRGSADLRGRVGMKRPGDEVTLDVLRGQERLRIAARLDELGAGGATLQSGAGGEVELSGLLLRPLGPDMPGYGLVEGLSVVSVAPQSPAERAGIRPGDVVLAVNRRPVATPEDLAAALDASRGNAVALLVWRDGREQFVILPR